MDSFIVLQLLITYKIGYNIYILDKSIDVFEGAHIQLNVFMSRNLFENISESLSFTYMPSPSFKDKFFKICQVVEECNYQMKDVFIPYCV